MRRRYVVGQPGLGALAEVSELRMSAEPSWRTPAQVLAALIAPRLAAERAMLETLVVVAG